MDVPVEPTDDELLAELKRVRSDLGFRKWISLRVKLVAALVAFDLFVSVLSIVAVVTAASAQHDGCVRDNQLRAAYTAQWQPLLDQAREHPDQAQPGTIERFQQGLDGFKQHTCARSESVILGVKLFVVGAIVLGLILLWRWQVDRRRLKRGR